jgi:hypothetical protein
MNADAGLPESTLPASVPVTEKDLSDTEARLHGKLPDDYRMMLTDPHRDAVGLRSPADVKRASETVAGLLVDLTDNGAIHVEDVARNEDHALSPEIVGRMVVVAGADQEWSSLVLVDLSGDAALACCRVLAFEDDLSTAYGSMTQWLRSNYANVEALGEMTRRQQQKQMAAWEESKDWNMASLLAGLARSRIRSGRVTATTDGPVTEQALAEAGKKLGGLPPDYQEMLALQNGEPILSLLPLAQISALDLASDEAAPFQSTPFVIEDATGKPVDKLAPGVALQNARALIVGAVVYPKPVGGKTRSPWIVAVESNGSWRYLDLANRRAYANLRELLHHGYARLQSVSWNDD